MGEKILIFSIMSYREVFDTETESFCCNFQYTRQASGLVMFVFRTQSVSEKRILFFFSSIKYAAGFEKENMFSSKSAVVIKRY